ncbi:MAG: type VII toxin-antitoxin system HepT family RNase toxin [Bacillota bacterium]
MPDIGLIMEKLKELDLYLKQLELHKGVTEKELAENLDESWIVERGLHLSIQVLLDIGNHILAGKGIAVEGYSDIFIKLATMGVIPVEFGERIKGMAGFRNILVHEYARIDLKKLVKVLNEGLDEIRHFASYIMKYIENQS